MFQKLFGKALQQNSLGLPPLATENADAVEVLRVWAAPGKPQQFTLRPTWKDPAAWGLLLVDVARQAAQAYEVEGCNAEEAVARIRAAWEAEWSMPTDRA